MTPVELARLPLAALKAMQEDILRLGPTPERYEKMYRRVVETIDAKYRLMLHPPDCDCDPCVANRIRIAIEEARARLT